MAKFLGVHELWRCAACRKVGAKIKVAGVGGVDVPHVERVRSRIMRKLAAEGWKFQAFRTQSGHKRRRDWCPDCRENKRIAYPSTADLAAELACGSDRSRHQAQVAAEPVSAPLDHVLLSMPCFEEAGQWTAELADESEPDGIVILKSPTGRVQICMSRNSWEYFRKGGSAPVTPEPPPV